MTRPHRNPRQIVSTVLKVVLAFGLLGYVIAANREQLRDVIAGRPDYGWLALAAGLYLSGVLLAFVRWFFLVRAVGLPFRLRDALRLGFIGLLFNLVIPGAVGGDVVKAAYLCREQGRKAEPIASVLVDRIIGLIGLFLLAALAGTIGRGRLLPSMYGLVTAAWIATGVTVGLLALAFLPLYRLRGDRPAPILNKLANVGRAYRSHPGVLALGIGMALATHLLNVLAFQGVGLALDPNVPGLADHLLIVPMVLFSTGIPLPLGALGASEQVSAMLFRLTNYDGGAVTMMGFRLLQFLGGGIGLILYFANIAQVRALREEGERMSGLEPTPPSPACLESRRVTGSGLTIDADHP